MNQVFTREKIREMAYGPAHPDAVAEARYLAANQINYSSERIQSKISSIRDRLADVERRLNEGGNVYEANIDQLATDLERAIAERKAGYEMLNTLNYLGDLNDSDQVPSRRWIS